MIHDAVREAECTMSWRTALAGSRAVLARGWDEDAWACAVSCLDFLGEFTELQESVERYLPDIERSGAEVRSFSYYIIGRLYQSTGEYDIALAAYMRSVAQGPSPGMRVLPLLQTSTINFFLGGKEEAQSNLDSVLRDALARGDAFSAAHALDFLCDLALRASDLDLAATRIAECREQAERAHNLYRLTWVLCLEGQLEFERGQHDRGLAKMEEARRVFEATGTRSSELHSCCRIGERLLRLGRLDEARTVIERGVELSQRFRYNLTRSKILRLSAELHFRRGTLSPPEYEHAKSRAEILEGRAHKSWRLIHGRSRIYSEADVARFLRTLDPYLFEVVCQRILESEGYACEPTPVNEIFLDIFATMKVGTSKTPMRWGVSCKRVIAGVHHNDIPDQTTLLSKDCKGFIVMTTGKVSGPAADKLITLEQKQGILTDIWEGPRLCSFLASHDWIMADVGTLLAPPPVTSPTPPAGSSGASRSSS